MPHHDHGKKPQHGSRAPPYFEIGTLIHEDFRIIKLIGRGGFGQVYKVTDERTMQFLAMKIGPESYEPGRLIIEQRVLSTLNRTDHYPRFIASGSFRGYNFIVMQLLGRSLGELRKKLLTRRMTLGTMIRVGRQGLAALKSLHEIGYLHRDIKPSNFCIGARPNRRIIYLVDFGMVRQFRRPDGSVRKERHYAGFRGTIRYV